MRNGKPLDRKIRGFTLLELLVVMGLIAALSFFLLRGFGNGGESASLKSAQALMANLVGVARMNAVGSGRASRVLIHIDPVSSAQPSRFLCYVAMQLQNVDASWQTVVETYLPEGVYVVPGNFSPMPAGLFATSLNVPWKKADNSDLRSTALRADRIATETIGGNMAEQWVSCLFSTNGTTFQSGDIILITGHRRPPGTYAEGEAPVELGNPGNVRGLTLSAYGVPVLVNARTSF